MPGHGGSTAARTPRQRLGKALAEMKEITMLDKTDLNSSTALRTITLDTPLDRPGGGEPITAVQVRKPGSGELRGLTLMALSQLDYAALETLLPRITIPTLQKHDIARLDPADLMQLGGEVMDFLLPKAAKAAASPEA